jgi:hypothetical protein
VIHNSLRLAILCFLCVASICAGESTESRNAETQKLIAPPKSLGTGLPFLPDLDLAKFTKEDFIRASSTVGTNRIRKEWSSPCAALPPHSRKDIHGLTTNEVKQYMTDAKRLFDDGKAIPVSDTGLISSQEDVIRRPMLNHISAFSNEVARVYLLVQKTSTDKGWGYFGIVEDLTATPPIDYFADLNGKQPRFEGQSCYKCHSSGPLAIHPAREDLVMDAPLAAAVSRQIAKQPMADFYWPPNEKKPNYGEPLQLEFCAECHESDGKRQPLYRIHSHPMRIYVDYGYMPPKHRLTPEQVAQLKEWLDQKP